jgi:hypothetical protein
MLKKLNQNRITSYIVESNSYGRVIELRPKKNYVDQKRIEDKEITFAEAARTLSDEKKQEQMVEH